MESERDGEGGKRERKERNRQGQGVDVNEAESKVTEARGEKGRERTGEHLPESWHCRRKREEGSTSQTPEAACARVPM